MKINKTIVCFFFSVLFILVCACYGQDESDNSRRINNPKDYFYNEEIDRFEEMFKTGDIDLEYLSSDRSNILHYAALTGNFDRVKLVLEKGADVSLADEHDKTPLHYAALCGNLELVKYLVEQGADVNAKDDDGTSVLHGLLIATIWNWFNGSLDMALTLTQKQIVDGLFYILLFAVLWNWFNGLSSRGLTLMQSALMEGQSCIPLLIAAI